MTKPLPLHGLLVADFSRVLAGPLCTQLLADEGARVIKVEDPRGDETRRWGPPFFEGTSTYFLSVNRNKESIVLDLRSDEGAALARTLLERADVVVDNFLPAQRSTLGLGDVLAINPRAIHCSIAGFDPDTAEANTPGYDVLAQAASGLMSITGEAGGDPAKVGVALADVLTAHHAHGAICAALYAREQSGRGARLEVSLFSATLASLVNVGQAALSTGHEAARYGNGHPSIVPYQLFHAADRPFAIGAATDRHFRLLCERVVDRPEWAGDVRFATNTARVAHRSVLLGLLDEILRTRAAEVWVARCREAAIPVSVVQGVLEALRSEPAAPLVGRVGAIEMVHHPVRFDGARLPMRVPPPSLGQDTETILEELRKSEAGAGNTPPGTPRGRR